MKFSHMDAYSVFIRSIPPVTGYYFLILKYKSNNMSNIFNNRRAMILPTFLFHWSLYLSEENINGIISQSQFYDCYRRLKFILRNIV